MKKTLHILAFMAGTFTTQGQYAWTYESLYDHVADSSGLELSFGQFEQKTLSNIHLGQWYGLDVLPAGKTEVFAMTETQQELLNLRFHKGFWQYGIGTSTYSLNTRTIDDQLFNILYADGVSGRGDYSFYSLSTLKHSATVGRKIGGFVEATLMVNAHQLNSLAELNYSGNLRHTQDELFANFSGNYHSFNAEYTDTARTIAFLPQGIADNESIYYSTFRYGSLQYSFGFFMKMDLSKKVQLNIFGNHFGSNTAVTTQRQKNSYSMTLTSTEIQTADLINTNNSPIIQPNGSYNYNETRSEKTDSTFNVSLQPQIQGASLIIKTSTSMDLMLSSSQTMYPTFVNNRHSILLRKNLRTNHLIGGILFENRGNSKNFYNLVFGGEYEVAPRLSFKFYSNTAINFNYLNQAFAPRSAARMQFVVGAEITLP